MNIKQLTEDCYQAAIGRGEYTCQVCKGKGVTEFQGLDADSTECDSCNATGIDPHININEKIAMANLELYKSLDAYINDEILGLKNVEKYIEENIVINFVTNFYHHSIDNTYEHHLAGVFIKIFELAGYENLVLDFAPLNRGWSHAYLIFRVNEAINIKEYSYALALLCGMCPDIEAYIKLRMEYEQ